PGTLSSLGMELDVLPVNNYRVYERLFPDAAIVDASPLIKSVRMIKSPYEMDLIRQAAQMSDGMFSQVKNLLTDGITELEFASRVEAVQRKEGHQGYVRLRTFNRDASISHIMSGSNLAAPSCSPGPTGGVGPNASFPYGAGHKIIEKHEPVQIDNVGLVGGYLVDQTRTFSVGRLPDKLLRVHDIALNIQQALVEMAGPGIEGEKLYNTALEMADDAGLGDFFMGWGQPVPFVGHGIGIELDELPVIGKNSGAKLREGMVLAFEPKFIFPGKGVAGIENSYLVTSNGLERLTLFADAIEVVG
ncbi:MAG: Xaa-Pro peptidase family protein, partial [Deltaproteobacteria bacterium]